MIIKPFQPICKLLYVSQSKSTWKTYLFPAWPWKFITNSSVRKSLKNPVKNLKRQNHNNWNKKNNISAIVDKASSYQHMKCRDVTNSWLDDKLPLAGLWLFLVEVILFKKRIQNYSFFLISRKMKPREM